jgi:hypothetical protein
MKFLCLLLALLTTVLNGDGQNTPEPQYVPIKWKVGDKRLVTQDNSITTFHSNDILFETNARSSYEISVLRKMEDGYEVALSKSTIDLLDDPMESYPEIDFLKKILNEVVQSFYNQELIFIIDKESGNVTAFTNESVIVELISSSLKTQLENMLRTTKPNIDDNTLQSLISETSQAIEGKMGEMLQSMMNSITYIFQVHGYPYVLNETYTTVTEQYEIDQVNYSAMTYTGELDVYSSLNGNTLSLKCTNRYNQQELYDLIISKEGKQDEIPFESFEVKDNSNYQIDTHTSWIKRCEIINDVVLKDIRVMDKMRIELNEL